jgi:hypothetical protein
MIFQFVKLALRRILMFSLVRLVHIGDSTLMIPVAAAIATFLLLNRAWNLTLWWAVLFLSSLALVIVSKIAFIGWGFGIKTIDYKAISGHATLTAAVLPVMFNLILQILKFGPHHAGIFLGLSLAFFVSVCLVVYGFHTSSEAIFGSMLGSIVSLFFLRIVAGSSKIFCFSACAIIMSITTFILLHYAILISAQYWMTSIALHLSGHDTPYSWHTWRPGD